MMIWEWLAGLEGVVLLWIQETLRGPVQDIWVMKFTMLGDAGMLFIAAGLILLCFKKTRRVGVAALLALLIGYLITNLTLKPLVSRPRPWIDVEGLIHLLGESAYRSFPSGHSTSAFAFAFAVRYGTEKKWLKWVAMIVAILMGLSRLYVGVHYPTDILGGVLVGWFSGWFAWQLCRKRKK